MVKTPGKRNGESEKQVLHATQNGKVEKKESGWFFLMKRATFMLEAQVEKITWKAFLLSEQNSQKDEYVQFLEEMLQESQKTATDFKAQVQKITWKAFLLSEQNRQKDEYVQYLEEMLKESQKTATDFMLANSSHHEEYDIDMTGSVSCQTEETTYPVGPVKEEVNVEIPTLPTLPLTTNIEKGSNEDRNEVVATAGDDGVEYSENNPLQVERIRRQKTRNYCRCSWCSRQGVTRHELYICFWCLSRGHIKKYSKHAEKCKARLAAKDKCLVCDGFKMTYSSFSDQIKCNLCKGLMMKDSWEKHSLQCMRKHFQVPCTC